MVQFLTINFVYGRQPEKYARLVTASQVLAWPKWPKSAWMRSMYSRRILVG